MLLEAFRFHAARSLERTERAARPVAAAAPRDRAAALEVAIDAVTDAVVGELRASGAAAAELSLVLEIPRAPALAADYAAWQARLQAVLREHAVALHSDDPELDVRILQAAMRGLQLDSLARPGHAAPRAEIRRLVERLLKAL
jgi:Tetracyclin repressor-like, C-terminal domain